MQYSPKLKKVMEEIKAILEREDLAAVVVLHTPGFSEYVFKIDPSYSCASLMPNGEGIRVNSKQLKTKAEKIMKLRDTSNMLHLMGETTGQMAMNLIQVSKVVDRKLDSDHYGPGHTSHTQQNN